ncbi:unnamed protein product [Heterobilharzia americana]|nr:unnamed protein product [Heterobilharzia americana]
MRHGQFSSDNVTRVRRTSCIASFVMPLDHSKEVLVKPSNVVFNLSDQGIVNTCEVLIVNKSARSLRFKILSTARSRYTLSTCKGLLKSGEFVKTDISVSRVPINDDIAKDFFKVQFFDPVEGSIFCEHYVCSTISRNPSSNITSRDSDSCSTWPSRYHDVGLSVSSLRTASLSRAATGLTSVFFSTAKAQNNLPNSNTLKICHTAGDTGKSATLFSDILSTSLFLLSLIVCLFGVLLPFFPNECKLWLLSKILREPPKSDFNTVISNPLTFPYETRNTYGYSKFYKQTSSHDTTFSWTNECPVADNPSKDEFNRQTRLAFFAFRAAFRSICKAIIALDPSVAIANMSWFCLGRFFSRI